MAYTRGLLSGSVNGCGIKVTQTASPGTTIHTAVAGTTGIDEVWLQAVNQGTAPIVVTLQWGGTTAPDNAITFTLPSQAGFIPIAAGIQLQNGLVIKAYASVTNVVVIYGHVNRITA